MGEPCYSIVRKPKGFESANEIRLKHNIEGDDLDACRNSIEELLQNLLDGEKFPNNLLMSVINRYQQMNRFTSGATGSQDKRIKKLLYILWECLPKRGADGRFLDRMVMVCGAFDKDLKHPNQYVCGSVLKALSKTQEPEVIAELVHSIERCLEWSHAYQRKNAVLAIARIYKNFPDLYPSAPKLIAEYLMKENDDECKRAALQALLSIAPEEAKSFLHSCNIPDIHCMNASIQLLFVEYIQKLFKRNAEEGEMYLTILTSLIKSSSSPSVRYQAATALMKFSKNPIAVKVAAACFIDICAKDSDNNVKLIALDSLINLKRVSGAERVLRNSIMDILCVLQTATDLELNEKILKLSLDLLSPINVGEVVVALRQEIKKMQETNVLGTQQETVKYRRLLVDTIHKIADRFPNSIVEFEMLDTLFDLLICSSIGERTSQRIILLFKVFMNENSTYQSKVIKKIQDCFNLVKDNSSIHYGFLQLLGDFSETKEQIEKSFKVIKESLGELPISAETLENEQNRPPLRSYYLKNKFDTCSELCYAIVKMACRYKQIESSKSETKKMNARFMLIIASILKIDNSNIFDDEGININVYEDHKQVLKLSSTVLQLLRDDIEEDSAKETIKKIMIENIRSQLSQLVKNLEKERFFSDDTKKLDKKNKFDDKIVISLFSSRDDDSGLENDIDTETEDLKHSSVPDMFGEVPLTGTIDPIYAYCKFDVNQYDVGLKIYLENRSRTKTFENVTIELASRGEGSSSFLERPEPIVLGPRAKACIATNVKIISAENKRLFGSIAYDVLNSDADREQVIMLNDISVNLTDYIRPTKISFYEFRDIWRDCEWENKVTVKTKLTDPKEYLTQLVNATNMRCVTVERGVSGTCLCLEANLYAKSTFGEEALVNVNVEKETPSSVVSGNVKIRSRSQGMALSLGEKITAAQNQMTIVPTN